MIEKENNTARRPRSEIEIKIDDAENGVLKQLKERVSNLTAYINLKRTAAKSAKQLFVEKQEKKVIAEVKENTEAVTPEIDETPKVETLKEDKQVEETVVEKPVEIIQIFTQPVQQERKPFDNDRGNKKFEPRKDFVPKTQTKPVEAPAVKEIAKKTVKQPALERKKPIDDKRKLSQKTMLKKGYIKSNASVEYDETGEIKKIRTRKSTSKKQNAPVVISKAIEHAIINTEIVPIKVLSEKIGKSCAEILKKLFELSIIKNINESIDFDTAELVSAELGVTLELVHEQTSEEKLLAIHIDDDPVENNENLQERPPIVTIMGHVDHGKTSLLDKIRHTNVTGGEAGGITQHIGAYSIKVNGKPITFLDTPGHEAFTAMRARGAQVTDIVILVVAADDGIMPQTIEAINHAKAANVPIIVAVNKMDKPTANPDKVKQGLIQNGLVPEEWGGDTIMCPVSAKTGAGIDVLLENINMMAEIKDLKANPNRKANGVIIEAKLDKGKGPVATVLVQNGTLKTGDTVVSGTTVGRIRAMIDDMGRQVKSAGPSMAVAILGLEDVPNAGDTIIAVEQDKLAKLVMDERKRKESEAMVKAQSRVTLDQAFNKIAEGKIKGLNIIVKADVQGSVEAVKQSLVKLSNEEVKVNILHSGAGAITESDVSLAESSNAIVIGFNVRPDAKARAHAEHSKVDVRFYTIIYNLLDDMQGALNGMLEPKYKENYMGKCEVRETFKITGVGMVAGCYVTDGKLVRNGKLRIYRDDIMIVEGNVLQLKRFKDDVKEVAQNYECGVSIENFNEIKVGDVIECYVIEKIESTATATKE